MHPPSGSCNDFDWSCIEKERILTTCSLKPSNEPEKVGGGEGRVTHFCLTVTRVCTILPYLGCDTDTRRT